MKLDVRPVTARCLALVLLLPALAFAVPPARTHKLACSAGNAPNEMRFIIELARERPVFFALWTARGGYRCSVYATRGDAYSRWSEHAGRTTVRMVDEAGTVTIEGKRGQYKLRFGDINKMRYCGMDGEMNAQLTLWSGRPACRWEDLSR